MNASAAMVLALICCSPAVAALPDLEFVGAHERALEQLHETEDNDYREAVARYEDASRERPFDVVLRVERCRFIAALMYDELGRYASAEADHARCAEELSDQFADHPEVVLYELESGKVEDPTARAEEILSGRAWSGWTSAQIARLHERLAFSYDAESNGRLAKHHALQALARDEGANTRLIAARWQIHAEEHAAALATLTSPFDYPGPQGWQAAETLRLLAELQARDQVLARYTTMRDEPEEYEPVSVAKSLLAVGAVSEARAELERAARDTWRGANLAVERFRLEYGHGSPEQALAAYETLRDFGFNQDPLLQYRVALAVRHPALPFRWRDLAAVAMLVAASGALALASLLMIAPVHYRGLARRLAGHQPQEHTGAWRLRHAWYALFALALAGVLALYCLPPLSLDPDSFDFWIPALTKADEIAGLQIAFFAVLCLLVAPLAVGGIRRGMTWTTHWPAIKAACVGAGIALALRSPLILALLAVPDAALNAKHRWFGLQPEIPATVEQFGLAAGFLVVGLVAPVVEEFLFRGVLLGAFARHLSFGWANVLQAALFAAFHIEPRLALITLAVGLLAGKIAHSSGGLLAPIILHCVFNAIAMLVFVL